VPDAVHSVLPLSSTSFTVTPVFFNVGINEMATLAESLGNTRPQDKSNLDNYERVNEYYYRFRKLHLPAEPPGQRGKVTVCYIVCTGLLVGLQDGLIFVLPQFIVMTFCFITKQ
jgi:hypothetical protein